MKFGWTLLDLGSHICFPLPQSVLAKVNEIAKHKAVVQDADTQSKVRAAGRAPQSNHSTGGLCGIPLQTVLTPSFLALHPLPQIHQVYEMMQRWDPVASSLPDVVQRLLTLRELHEQGEGQGRGMLGTVAWCDKGDPGVWGPSRAEFSPPSQPHSLGRSLCTWTPRSRR